MALSSAAATVLLLLLCHQYQTCSASRPQPLLPAIKPQQQYGDGIDPIAADQPTFPLPEGGPTQLPFVPITPPYPRFPNFPSFQRPALPQLPPPAPRSTTTAGGNPNIGGGESAPAAGGNNNNNNDNTIAGRGRVGAGQGFPYQSMPSYIPKFPPFPFIPTMPSVPLPRLQPDSGGLPTATPSSSSSSSSASSSLSSSSPACTDKGQSQTGGSHSQPGH